MHSWHPSLKGPKAHGKLKVVIRSLPACLRVPLRHHRDFQKRRRLHSYTPTCLNVDLLRGTRRTLVLLIMMMEAGKYRHYLGLSFFD